MQGMRKGAKADCVKIACDGDHSTGVPSYQLVRIPRSHPVFFHQRRSSQIAKVCLCMTLEREASAQKTVKVACLHAAAHLEVFHLSIAC
jgi:hypothetical protein